MLVPVLGLGQSLGQHIVKVGVVREDDMATHIEKEALLGHIGGSKTTRLRIGIHKSPASEVLNVSCLPQDTYELVETLRSTQTSGA